MKDYSSYTPLDFAQDDQFLKWVKFPGDDVTLDRFWEGWLVEHPHKAIDVEEAKSYIMAIARQGEFAQTPEKKMETWSRLEAAMGQSEPAASKPARQWHLYKIAATVLLLLAATATTWWIAGNRTTSSLATNLSDDMVKEINNAASPKTIVLADGSSIVLKPNSTLEYPRSFKTEYREVILTGEAFFEIARDPKRPFLVYADKLVTKVLGTSFVIRAFEEEENIVVLVKTGKVSVSTQQQAGKNDKEDTRLNGVLLNPNQQVVFSRTESTLVKSLVENPTLLAPSAKQNFEFEDVPLRDVFAALEQAYGVDIIYEEELIGSCLVNISLDDMPLYDKMRLICKVVSAKYEILDSHIIVSGKGCKD